jgi:hypothetical protein
MVPKSRVTCRSRFYASGSFGLPDDLHGKSTLHIGAWDEWFSFEMERRDAEMTRVDRRHPEVGRFGSLPKPKYQPGAGRAVYAVGRDGSPLAYVNFRFLRCLQVQLGAAYPCWKAVPEVRRDPTGARDGSVTEVKIAPVIGSTN